LTDLDGGVEEEAGMFAGTREISPHPIAPVRDKFKRLFWSEHFQSVRVFGTYVNVKIHKPTWEYLHDEDGNHKA
jgi:hypothetical protein